MEFIHDNERLCSFRALLYDSKRIAAMEQTAPHDGDVEFSERRSQIVSVAMYTFALDCRAA